MQSAETQYDSIQFMQGHPLPGTSTRQLVLSNWAKTLLHCGFVIAVCSAQDGVFLISLSFSYTRSVLFLADPAKLETPSTYINFDLLYATASRRIPSFLRSQAPYLMRKSPPHNPTKSLFVVVSDVRHPRSYVTVLYNHGRRLLVEPEAGMLLPLLDLITATESR